jgi:hypothetical protein
VSDPSGKPSRAVNNLIVGAFLVALIAVGVWLVRELQASRKAQECLESGRRNCRQIEVPK